MSHEITDGRVVSFQYVLRDDAGSILDASEDDDPMVYLHGADNIVTGLERALAGRGVGAHVEVTVEPRDGYGERLDAGVREFPREAFPDEIELEEGLEFMVEGPDGEPTPMWVVSVDDQVVRCDGNHPLAGMRLHFVVDVVAIREATPEELEHGHPHGADGHDHEHDHGE